MTYPATSVSEAVDRRISVRAFLPDPVEGHLVRDILEKAGRAPSGGNVQPWHVYALAGEPLARLKAVMLEKTGTAQAMRDIPFEPTEYTVYPTDLWAPHTEWRFECGEDMYRTINVERGDKTARMRHFTRNFQFFDAPVGLFFTLDRRMGPPQWSDVGMYMQTVMLLGVEAGLGTCPQECWNMFPRTIAQEVEIPDNEILFSGMALGYPDPAAPLNTLRTKRASFDHYATMQGF